MLDLGRIGIWTGHLDVLPAREAQAAAAAIETLGYGAIWLPESLGRESFTNSSLLLAATSRIVIATGITNLWGRDAVTMAAAQKTLCEAFPDRFLLGIGVSHAPLVAGVRGHEYKSPLRTMRTYLDAMDKAPFSAVPPAATPRVLAALGPQMLALAAKQAAGAHPYFVPVEHTAEARRILGPDPLLAPEQAVIIERDPAAARTIARTHMQRYLDLPNYTNNLRRLGFGDADLENGGSDRLVDAIVAWGTPTAIRARVEAHLAAGANHVCVQVLDANPRAVPHAGWRTLAPVLLG